MQRSRVRPLARLSTRAAPAALAALFLAACGDSTGPGSGDAITTLPRDLTAAEATIVGRSGGFGLDLMARVAADDPRANLVLSPLSASMALGMTMNGTATSTFDGMRTALGFDGLTQAEINDGYRGLIDLLTGLDPDVTFGIGNAVWANEEFPFHQSFFDTVSEAFDAAVVSADFASPSTLQAINDWVAD
ncbi:MAG: serpin family protein, partial [Longimicrobiales bacterium]